jgi:hypothetical protein
VGLVPVPDGPRRDPVSESLHPVLERNNMNKPPAAHPGRPELCVACKAGEAGSCFHTPHITRHGSCLEKREQWDAGHAATQAELEGLRVAIRDLRSGFDKAERERDEARARTTFLREAALELLHVMETCSQESEAFALAEDDLRVAIRVTR